MTSRDTATLQIADLLRELGFDTAVAARRARAALESAGLTRAGKQGIAAYKRDAAEAALASALMRVCSDGCAKLARAREPREPVRTLAGGCEVCGGSNNRRAAIDAARSLRENGVSRVLIVGGTGALHRELEQLWSADGITVEWVDGTRASHSQRDADANMGRAQLLLIWGSTPLRHAVSRLYTQEPPAHLRVITVPRRGIAALCGEIVKSYGR